VTNTDVVRSWVRVINEGDLDSQLAPVDPAFEMVEAPAIPGAARVSGLEQLKSYSFGNRGRAALGVCLHGA
jgi:hypothetical protein